MRPRADRCGIAAFVLVALAAPSVVWGQPGRQGPRSPQEERRRKLLEEMGLKEEPPPPPQPSAQPAASAPGAALDKDADQKASSADPGGKGAAAGHRPPSAPPSFRRVIHPLFVQTCKVCHIVGGPAAATALVLSGEAVADHAAIVRVLDVRAPASSLLLTKASGQKLHAGGAPWPPDGRAYERVLAWIQGGARLDGGGVDAVAPVPPDSPLAPPRPAASTQTTPSSAAPPAAKIVALGAQAPTPPSPVAAVAVPGVNFAVSVHPLLMASCASCHATGKLAGTTRLALSGDVSGDYTRVRALVSPASPAQSVLIVKASGQGHAGGPLLPIGSAGHTLLLAWVTEGATEGSGAAKGAPPAPSPATPLPVSMAGAGGAPAGSSPPPASGPPSLVAPGGPTLPFGLSINGRFDVAYERRGFSGDPFVDSATNGLRSYHHFLFLSRELADDPFGLSVEMLSLQFWEAHYRWNAPRLPVQVMISGGKILVPFGADPLMHQSYGGLSGFDQRILPVIWAEEGVAVHVVGHRRELAITDDLYVVRGYTLQQADGIINLQNDFSPADNARLGWGNRLGGAWGPISAWYSTYYNGLGFGRRLFMQAGDVMLWRVRQVPILGHFSFAAGLLRADVSGGNGQGVGGPGKDYYDFGSYFQVRYHPTDWLYFQYRQGVFTFNNRRGVVVDDTRLTSNDGSTHNFGVVARTHGLTAGLYYFINLEKVNEIPNDLLRLSVSYDF